MNILPVSMLQKNVNFGCSECKKEVPHIVLDESNDDEIVSYSNMGSDYFYPVTASQVARYKENEDKFKYAYEHSRPLEELQGETLDEYLERHKLEFSM